MTNNLISNVARGFFPAGKGYWKQAVVCIPLLSFLVLFAGTDGLAAVSGACYNCHTMHNSQGGLTMILDSTISVGGATGECLGCHAIPREEALRLD